VRVCGKCATRDDKSVGTVQIKSASGNTCKSLSSMPCVCVSVCVCVCVCVVCCWDRTVGTAAACGDALSRACARAWYVMSMMMMLRGYRWCACRHLSDGQPLRTFLQYGQSAVIALHLQ
jgi:hypothetical protein